ncbi:hypothetical protein M0802_008370 [Mischocyttarus mexicanus]|nr:hypothetical protein M0802_008370 [Mischocyttarus mexicanus]
MLSLQFVRIGVKSVSDIYKMNSLQFAPFTHVSTYVKGALSRSPSTNSSNSSSNSSSSRRSRSSNNTTAVGEFARARVCDGRVSVAKANTVTICRCSEYPSDHIGSSEYDKCIFNWQLDA